MKSALFALAPRGQPRRRHGPALGWWVLASAWLTGCPNPQTYGTPRTTPVGKATHTIAPEAIRLTGTSTTTESDPATGETVETEEDVSVTFPLLPTYQVRIGAADTVDIGIKLANLTSLGADVKVNPIRGKFDLAIAPGLQWYAISIDDTLFNIIYGHLPLMLGINLSADSSLVLTPGMVYSWASATDSPGGEDAILTSPGVAARLGVGFEYRVDSGFALHPEVTAIRGLAGDLGDTSSTILLFGFGFNFGRLPDYSDLLDS